MSFDAPVSIRVTNLSKCYQIYSKPYHRLMQFIFPRIQRAVFRDPRAYYKDFWALRDVSFEVKRGETVGIVGRNGAGKSTLLQMVCGTVTPTAGAVQVTGRVAALLELGAGFNPDFTGRENVFMYAAILGVDSQTIREKLEDILAFADIGEFIDQPVKFYSSGMFVRLAFAVSACIEPDVLIVDEALSVGDTRFQLKCIERINQLKSTGTTILFVSHSSEQVKRLCDRAIWLDHGAVRSIGYAPHVCDEYESFEDGTAVVDASAKQSGTKVAKIISIEQSRAQLNPFDSYAVEVTYEIFDASVARLLLGLSIRRSSDDLYVFGPNTALDSVDVPSERGVHKIRYSIKSLPLLGGDYYIETGLFTDKGLVKLDFQARAREFRIQSDYIAEGLVYIDHVWTTIV